MFNNKILKVIKKITESENNLKSIRKERQNSQNWSRIKELMEKEDKVYELWYKRSGILSSLLGVRVYNLA